MPTNAAPRSACTRLESLEPRRLLSGGDVGRGVISGVVFDDRNANAVHQSGEGGVRGARVYLDHDNDGTWDKGREPGTVTDKRGNFAFNRLGAGTYRLRQVVPADRVQVGPRSGFFRVNLRDGQKMTRRMFADTPVSALPEPSRSAGAVGGAVITGIPAGSDALLKYTYYGESDLSGSVNFNDYARTDPSFIGNPTGGFFYGDFDYSGSVDFDDYTLIDLGFVPPNGQTVAANPEQLKAAVARARKDFAYADRKGTVDEALRWLQFRDRSAKSAKGVRDIAAHYSQYGANYKREFLRLAKDA